MCFTMPNMRSPFLCQAEGCDASAHSASGRSLCGGHWHRLPDWRRREITHARLREDWDALGALVEAAVTEVDALEAVPA